MKHHIIVKFTEEAPSTQELLPGIKAVFEPVLKIEGVHAVEYKPNVIPRANRYDLMIAIDMEESALPVYDESEAHKKWKSDYGALIAKKAIFDSAD